MKKPRKRAANRASTGPKNPALSMSNEQMGKIAGDLAIQTMFGLLGTALATSSPSLKAAMLKIATTGGIEITPGIVAEEIVTPRYGDCQCSCHFTAGIVHCVPCCWPSDDNTPRADRQIEPMLQDSQPNKKATS